MNRMHGWPRHAPPRRTRLLAGQEAAAGQHKAQRVRRVGRLARPRHHAREHRVRGARLPQLVRALRRWQHVVQPHARTLAHRQARRRLRRHSRMRRCAAARDTVKSMVLTVYGACSMDQPPAPPAVPPPPPPPLWRAGSPAPQEFCTQFLDRRTAVSCKA